MRTACLRAATLALLLYLIAVGGCSNGRPPTYPVEGLIRFEDGEPVPFGTIEFFAPEMRLSARGKIDATGHFSLSTFSKGDGAVAGEQRVVIVQNVSQAALESTVPHEHQLAHDHTHNSNHHEHESAHNHHGDDDYAQLVHMRYADYRTSDLVATVKPQSENRIELIVSRQ